MGQKVEEAAVVPEGFDEDDRRQFRRRLDDNLEALCSLLEEPGFGHGPSSMGAELEFYIVDSQGRPLPISQEIMDSAEDSRLTPEINRYNIEANLTPRDLTATCLSEMENEMVEVIDSLNGHARERGGRVVPVGILPSLRPRDLRPEMMTDDPRYHLMTRELRIRRGEKFRIQLRGRERIDVSSESVTPEGANTSFQLHYRAHPERFVDLFNAVQLTTPLVLGLSTNSPYFLGRELWHETRISLFRQSIDGRSRKRRALKLPQRVHLGHGWLRRSALELFAETVHLYDPLLPICQEQETTHPNDGEQRPRLAELALQMGSVWPWNRAVYDHHDDGHVRVELRYLPAGPTPLDMWANAAFAIGLVEGLLDDIEGLLHSMPHAILERNLLLAARLGMDAGLLWPSRATRRLEPRPLRQIAHELLPTAERGLRSIGIGDDDIERYLSIIEARLSRGMNGSQWQIETVASYEASGKSRKAALRCMFNDYASQSFANRPVHKWPIGDSE